MRVRSSYIKAMVSVGRLDRSGDFPSQGAVYTKRMVATRIEALRDLEEAVNSARRVGEPALVQDGCIVIWNTALPLLQPSLIGYAERALYLAASPSRTILPCACARRSTSSGAPDLPAPCAPSAAPGRGAPLDLPAGGGVADRSAALARRNTLGTRLALARRDRVAESPEKVVLPPSRRWLKRGRSKRCRSPDAEEKLSQRRAPTGDRGRRRLAGRGGQGRPSGAATATKRRRKRRRRRADASRSGASARAVGGLMRAGWALRQSAWRAPPPSRLRAWTRTRTRARARQADARYARRDVRCELQQCRKACRRRPPRRRPRGRRRGRRCARVAAGARRGGGAEAAARAVRRGARLLLAGVGIGLAGDDLVVHNGYIYVINYNLAAAEADYAPLLPRYACRDALQKCDQGAMRGVPSCASPPRPRRRSPGPRAARRPPPAAPTARAHGAKDADQAPPRGARRAKWACELCAGQPSIKRSSRRAGPGCRRTGHQGPVGPEPEARARCSSCSRAASSTRAPRARRAWQGRAAHGDGRRGRSPSCGCAARRHGLGDLANVVKACDAALRPCTLARRPRRRPLPAAPAAAPARGGRAQRRRRGAKGILRDEWRWYAMAEVVHAEAIGKLLKEGQQKALQQQLHSNALTHLAAAMVYANHAAEPHLLLGAAQRFWGHVKPFIPSKPPDHRLRGPVGTALAELEKLPEAFQPRVVALRVRLHEAQLAVLAHAQAWSEGLKLLHRAFASLPEASMQPLWEEKVNFMCKGGGKGLMGEMHKLKDFEPPVQARVWSVLGRSAPTTGEQLGAMIKSVDVLAAEPLLKVGYLISLAQWLYTHDFPSRDSEDQLMAAIDILMDYEDVPEDDDDDDADVASSVSGSTRLTSARSASVSGQSRSVPPASSRAGSTAGGAPPSAARAPPAAARRRRRSR